MVKTQKKHKTSNNKPIENDINQNSVHNANCYFGDL
jgi:hypothetical protein